MPINEQTAEEAYNAVLEHVGCSFPVRDAVDLHIINDTKTGTASHEGATYKQTQTLGDPKKICGIIDTPADSGGWPVLNSLPAPTDTDHDGMPDNWEKAHSLNPNDVNDGKLYSYDINYTNLELYLNSLTSKEVLLAINDEVNSENQFSIFPNPVNNVTTISFKLLSPANTSLSVIDNLGNSVSNLSSGPRAAGTYTETFDASRLPNGIYFARLTITPENNTNSYFLVKKMILNR